MTARDRWVLMQIKDIGRVVTGRTPPSDVKSYFGDLYPFITPSDMDGRKVIKESERKLSSRGAELLRSNKLPAHTVCVSCIGWQMGKVVMTATDSFTNQQINSIIPNTKVTSEFLYYSLSTRRDELKALASVGTRTPILIKSTFEKLGIYVPPLSIQQNIVAVLRAYDDLIENNTRRIAVLERMAQALYREWFVYFRFPGHESVPLVASPLGPIPAGWEVKEMAQIADVIDCLHSKKPDDIGRGGLLLQLWNISDGGKLDLTKPYLISPDNYKLWTSRIEVSEGDCIITNVGRVGAVAQIPTGTKAALGRNMTAIRCKLEFITPTFLIEHLLSPHMQQEVKLKTDVGTVMDSLNVKGIVKLNVILPPLRLVTYFESIARPIRREIEILMSKMQNLRRTRDLLLPRLISGELDVADLAIREMDPA